MDRPGLFAAVLACAWVGCGGVIEVGGRLDPSESPKPSPPSPPSPGCGGLTAKGVCEGSVVRFCDLTKSPPSAVESDCAAKNAICGEVAPGTLGCVKAPSCASETPAGRCAGNTLVYCAVTGAAAKVVERPCGAATCSLNATPSGAGCVTTCNPGDTWCADSQRMAVCTPSRTISYTDCASTGALCQMGPSAACVPVTGSRTLKGSVFYPFRKPASTGHGALEWRPAHVGAVGIQDGKGNWLALAPVNETYTLTLPPSVGNSFELYALAQTVLEDGSRLRTLSHSGAVLALKVAHTMKGDHDTLNLNLAEPTGPAFTILEEVNAALKQATSQSGPLDRSLNLYWEMGKLAPVVPGESASCIGCFTNADPWEPSAMAILLSGDSKWEDHYDPSIIRHEVGHLVVWRYSREDHPGGEHAELNVPTFSWSEGFATAFAQLSLDDPILRDGDQTGLWWVDLSRCSQSGQALPFPSSLGGIQQNLNELVVASMIWGSAASSQSPISGALKLGLPKVWTLLTTYLAASSTDRGYKGIDLVDFIDGLICKGLATSAQVSSFFVTSFKFPYDFKGPGTCP